MSIRITKTTLDGVLVIEPDLYNDDRGYFFELWNARKFDGHGIEVNYVQDNVSFSKKNVLRGLHYQFPKPQAKLVSVLSGEIFDVAVDIRKGSPTFGKWFSVILSDKNKKQLFIPAGFAHGFCVTSDNATVMYKCDEYYASDCEHTIVWSDKSLAIDWPSKAPILSSKDKNGTTINDMKSEHFPEYSV